MLAAWAGALPAILVALLVLWIPGLIVTASLRLGVIPRTALAGATSVTLIGVAGVLFGLLRLPFSIWQPLLLAVIGGAAVWLLRRRLGRMPVQRAGLHAGWLVLAWVAASVTIAVVAFAAVPSPERISQTYDNVFHLSAISHILQTGDASSLTLRTLIETTRSWSFYPSGWHSTVALTAQLSGVSVPVAVNATWIAACAALWLPGVAWLSQVLVRGFDRHLVALVALPLGVAFGAMPYGLLTWGTLYPTFFATALVPAALAAPLAIWLPRRRREGSGYSMLAGVAATIVVLAAVGFGQPRVLVTWAVVLLPFAIAETVRAYRWARTAGGRSRVVAGRALVVGIVLLILAAAGAFAYLVFRLGLFERPLDDRLGGPQAKATQSVAAGLWQVVSQSWPLGLDGVVTFPAILLAAAVLVGVVIAARTRGMRWLLVAYAVFAVLFALAAGSDDVFSKLATALWYKDRYRLSSALPIVAVPLATLGIVTCVGWMVRGRRVLTAVSAALTVLIAGTAAIGLAAGGVTSSVAFVFRMPDRGATSEVVSRAQIDFMRDVVAQTVPADQRLLGDPWDGSALSREYAGRQPVFPHVNGQWDPDRALIAWHLQDIGTDPAVCRALDALRVRYVLYHPHEFGGGDPSGNHFIGVHTAVKDGLFTEVATDGDSTLYRIDQCGPLPG
ncbi:DUF6541 family protein [Microbacterium sp. SORGH_AS_0888]|uniref:DUF6541 family protein n=1 Tax=Microbacterium sp. SORGH_AS_0888 TaxID=3041791 RepID=UPI0027860867|nr:DUF6541 family protein [Microbacterium sp. SORGH_AS_0888]MDQ1127890.1 hypothetical protein [Microbacterium sp. SORGH_AS_0888]